MPDTPRVEASEIEERKEEAEAFVSALYDLLTQIRGLPNIPDQHRFP